MDFTGQHSSGQPPLFLTQLLRLASEQGSAKFQPKAGMAGILVPWGCHNKAPKTEWLKTTEIHSLKVLDAGSPKSGCQEGLALFSISGGESSLASSSFWCLPAILGIPWFVEAPLQSLPLSSSGYPFLPLCPKFLLLISNTNHIGLEDPPPTPVGLQTIYI